MRQRQPALYFSTNLGTQGPQNPKGRPAMLSSLLQSKPLWDSWFQSSNVSPLSRAHLPRALCATPKPAPAAWARRGCAMTCGDAPGDGDVDAVVLCLPLSPRLRALSLQHSVVLSPSLFPSLFFTHTLSPFPVPRPLSHARRSTGTACSRRLRRLQLPRIRPRTRGTAARPFRPLLLASVRPPPQGPAVVALAPSSSAASMSC